MKSLDLIVMTDALKWLQSGHKIWLCTVLSTYGSAPRTPGALFAAIESGAYVGSLSGGCIEEDFLKRIAHGEFQKKSEVIQYGNGENAFSPTVSLPCGGSIDVLIEHLHPSKESIHYIEMMLQALTGKAILQKEIILGQMAILTLSHTQLPQRVIQEDDKVLIALQCPTTIFIAGISAVALYCIEFAHALGFNVIVCDDREEELRQLRSQPHILEKVTLREIFPPNVLEEEGCHAQTAILSLTHDPRIDDFTMIAACATPAFYIGAMGSQKNSDNRLARIKECTDYSAETLRRIHAPIGLSIGSKTPAEIALAIMADIVQAKNTKNSNIN